MVLEKRLIKKFAEKSKLSAFFTSGHVKVSNCGSYLFCQFSSQIKILEIDNGAIFQTIGLEDDSEVTSFSISHDDEFLVVAYQNLTLKQYKWNVTPVECQRSWKAIHATPVSSSAFDVTSTLLATGGSDSTIKVWDVLQKYCTHNLRGHGGLISVVKFHPDPEALKLFSGSHDNNIRVWDLRSSTCIAQLSSHLSSISALEFSVDHTLLYSGGRDKVVIVWDLKTLDKVKTVPIYEVAECIVVLPKAVVKLYGKERVENKSCFTTFGDTGLIKVWDYKTSHCVFEKDQLHKSPDSEILITNASYNEKTNLITFTTQDHNIVQLNGSTLKTHKQLVGYNDEVLSMTFLGVENSHIAVATNSDLIRVYQLADKSCQLLQGHTDVVQSVHSQIIHNISILVSCGKDQSICVWRMDSQSFKLRCISRGQGHTHGINTVKLFNMNSNLLVSGSADLTIKLWRIPAIDKIHDKDYASLEPLVTQKAHEKIVNALSVSLNNLFVASASNDKTAKLWNAKDLSLAGTFSGHKRGLWDVRFSPIDQCIATSSSDMSIKIWSIKDFSCVKTFEGHTGSVLQVDFLNRGMQLISSGSDGLLKLWTISSNECVCSLDSHEGKIWSLAINRQVKSNQQGEKEELVATGGNDSLIILWEDVTRQENELVIQQKEQLLLQEQKLENLVKSGDYLKAISLAISLDRPFRLMKLVSELCDQYSESLDLFVNVLSKLRTDHIDSLLRYCVHWNTNTKTCHIAQYVLQVILENHEMESLLKLPNIKSSIEGLIPYTERHYQRMKRLSVQSKFLDFTSYSMHPVLLEKKVDLEESHVFSESEGEEVTMQSPTSQFVDKQSPVNELPFYTKLLSSTLISNSSSKKIKTSVQSIVQDTQNKVSKKKLKKKKKRKLKKNLELIKPDLLHPPNNTDSVNFSSCSKSIKANKKVLPTNKKSKNISLNINNSNGLLNSKTLQLNILSEICDTEAQNSKSQSTCLNEINKGLLINQESSNSNTLKTNKQNVSVSDEKTKFLENSDNSVSKKKLSQEESEKSLKIQSKIKKFEKKIKFVFGEQTYSKKVSKSQYKRFKKLSQCLKSQDTESAFPSDKSKDILLNYLNSLNPNEAEVKVQTKIFTSKKSTNKKNKNESKNTKPSSKSESVCSKNEFKKSSASSETHSTAPILTRCDIHSSSPKLNNSAEHTKSLNDIKTDASSTTFNKSTIDDRDSSNILPDNPSSQSILHTPITKNPKTITDSFTTPRSFSELLESSPYFFPPLSSPVSDPLTVSSSACMSFTCDSSSVINSPTLSSLSPSKSFSSTNNSTLVKQQQLPDSPEHSPHFSPNKAFSSFIPNENSICIGSKDIEKNVISNSKISGTLDDVYKAEVKSKVDNFESKSFGSSLTVNIKPIQMSHNSNTSPNVKESVNPNRRSLRLKKPSDLSSPAAPSKSSNFLHSPSNHSGFDKNKQKNEDVHSVDSFSHMKPLPSPSLLPEKVKTDYDNSSDCVITDVHVDHLPNIRRSTRRLSLINKTTTEHQNNNKIEKSPCSSPSAKVLEVSKSTKPITTPSKSESFVLSNRAANSESSFSPPSYVDMTSDTSRDLSASPLSTDTNSSPLTRSKRKINVTKTPTRAESQTSSPKKPKRMPLRANTPTTIKPNTPAMTKVNTPTTTKVSTPTKTKANTPVTIKDNTPTMTKANMPITPKVNTPSTTKANTPISTRVNTPTKTKTNTPTTIKANTPITTKVNTPDTTKVNTSLRTKANTPTTTKVNTPTMTKANTPTMTKANTPTMTKANTPTTTKANTPTTTKANTSTTTKANTSTTTKANTPTTKSSRSSLRSKLTPDQNIDKVVTRSTSKKGK